MRHRARGLGAEETRILAAFAEAMAPGGTGLPAAESEVPVSARMAELSRWLPERTVRFMGMGIRAFDWLTFPRRFSRADLGTRQRALERIAASRRGHHRELLMLMKTLAVVSYAGNELVRVAVGSEARCEVDGSSPPPAGPLGDLTPRGSWEECDVAIVGSGAGGAVTAAILAEAGLDVLVLEAGPHRDRNSYPADALAAIELYRDGGLTVAEGLPIVPIPSGRAVGGTTVINSGTCFRTPEDVLASWRDELGVSWATELDGHYAEVERMLDVTRIDPERMGRNGELVRDGALAIGIGGEPLLRNAGRCVQCSSCPQGCRLDAKRGSHVTWLPRAVAAGARIRSGVEARRVIFEGGRARGLQCVAGVEDPDGLRRPFTVRARRAVVAAGGSLGTPELLLRSGVEGPAIGRNLHLHPSSGVGAFFDEPVRGWEGVMQSYGIDHWAGLGLMLEATFTPLAYGAQWLPGVGLEHQRRLLAFDRVGTNGVQLRDVESSGRVRLARDGTLRVSYRLRRPEARKLFFGIARAVEIWFAAGAREVYPLISGNPVLRPGDLAAFEASTPRTSDLRLESFHPMGTARLGSDPTACATDIDGSVRGTRDLYVTDASLLPTALGVNPMLTIMACAAQIATGLAERLG